MSKPELKTVPCDRCQAVYPSHCDRCAFLIRNMHRWRQVAELEHDKHCTQRGHCGPHIETIYNELLAAES